MNSPSTQIQDNARKNSFDELPLVLQAIKQENTTQSGYSDGSRPLADHLPSTFDDDVWRLGWTDGRIGELPGVEAKDEFFENQARLWLSRKSVQLNAELATEKIAYEGLQALRDEKEAEFEKLKEIQKDVADHSLRHNAKFSSIISVMLLLLGLVVLMADLPLTAQLAVKSLGFPDSVCVDSKTSDTSAIDPQANSCGEGQTLYTLNGNLLKLVTWRRFPDVFLLAIALASCSFVIKLFMDALNLGHFDKTSPHRKKSWATAFVAIATLVLLCVLGMVRQGIFNAETSNLRSRAEEITKQLPTIISESDKATLENDRSRLMVQIEGRQSSWVGVGFILLTALFPIISGIFLHYSAVYWHHRGIAMASENDRLTHEDQLQAARDKLLQKKESVAKLEALIHSLQEASVVKLLQQQWSETYKHGLRRGESARNTFDSSPSHFFRALHVVERRLG